MGFHLGQMKTNFRLSINFNRCYLLGRPSFRKTQLNLDFSKQGGAGGLGDHPIQILTM